MAIYRLYPEKDATLYTNTVDLNTGRDAMLELGSNKLGEAMRAVIEFDDGEIDSTLSTELSGIAFYTASLQIFVANAENLGTDSSIHVHPLAEDWDEGLGHYGDAPYNSIGVSWKYRDGNTAWDTNTYDSLHPGGDKVGGGTWINTVTTNYPDPGDYNAIASTAVISSSYYPVYKGTLDIKADVTQFVRSVYHDEVTNYGLLLKMAVNEFSTGSLAYMQLFSSDTNTIYYPYLEFEWNDFTYSTSLTLLTAGTPFDIIIKDIEPTYAATGKVRFRIHARPKYPAKTFRTTNTYLDNYRLSSQTYWGIKDEATGEMVVNFSNPGTKVSADGISSYFDVYMDNLFVERHYTLVVKTVMNDDSVHIVESGQSFKLRENG